MPQWSGAASLPLPCSLGMKMNVHPVTLAHFPLCVNQAFSRAWRELAFQWWVGTTGQRLSLAGLDLRVEYAGPDIWQAHSSCGCYIVVQGPAGGGWHWLPHSLSGDSHSTVSSSTPVLSWRVLLLRKPLPVPDIFHTGSDLPFQHPGSRGRRIGHSRPALAT